MRLLSDILDTAKIEAGELTLERAVFDPREVVREAAALWSALATDKGIGLVIDIDPDLGTYVQGDAVRLRQVLSNLVSNALKFTQHGHVTVKVHPVRETGVRFEVRDTGLGFDADQKARIFQRFHQADGSITRRFGGTGLGLSISSALVELMGGALDCESTPGQGSVFHFEIPLLPAEAPQVDPVDAVTPHLEMGRPLRVLLADDHPANRKVVEIMLSAVDVELVSVEDGQKALDLLAAECFDLVLMDMQMPVLDGLTATRSIRLLETQRGSARTPIVMLTANALAEHVEAGRRAGADGHLAKPVTLDTLLAAINAALNGAEESRAAA